MRASGPSSSPPPKRCRKFFSRAACCTTHEESMNIEDIVYRTVDGQPLLGRLYQPANAQAALVEVHGGAWTMNDRLTNAVIHQHLATNGIAVFSLDFRMAPSHPYPAALEDVNRGIRFMRSRFKRVGGLGTSSGGYLIVLAALRADEQARLDFV